VIRADCRGFARDLHDDLVERHLVIERLRAADHAVAAGHGGFDEPAVGHLDHERDDAAVREVHGLHPLMRLRHHMGVRQRDGAQVCEEGRQVARGEPREDLILAVRHAAFPCRSGGSTAGLSAIGALLSLPMMAAMSDTGHKMSSAV
jgi:hypothetical protein